MVKGETNHSQETLMVLVNFTNNVKETFYGDSSGTYDAVILCQHGDDGCEFFKHHKDDITALSSHDSALLQAYMAIEQDVGNSELAHAIAQQLVDGAPRKLGVAVLDVLLPRAFIDANRIREMP